MKTFIRALHCSRRRQETGDCLVAGLGDRSSGDLEIELARYQGEQRITSPLPRAIVEQCHCVPGHRATIADRLNRSPATRVQVPPLRARRCLSNETVTNVPDLMPHWMLPDGPDKSKEVVVRGFVRLAYQDLSSN